jgi:hypothetical protein
MPTAIILHVYLDLLLLRFNKSSTQKKRGFKKRKKKDESATVKQTEGLQGKKPRNRWFMGRKINIRVINWHKNIGCIRRLKYDNNLIIVFSMFEDKVPFCSRAQKHSIGNSFDSWNRPRISTILPYIIVTSWKCDVSSISERRKRNVRTLETKWLFSPLQRDYNRTDDQMAMWIRKLVSS